VTAAAEASTAAPGWEALPELVDEQLLVVAGWPEEQVVDEADRAAAAIAASADQLWHSRPGRARGLLGAVATGLAILARRPRGVTVLGGHWCARPHVGCPGRGDPVVVAGSGVGVHYTPWWMAERVTRDTLDALCAEPGPMQTWDTGLWRGRPLDQVAGLRVADIACGSGMFLLAAAAYLTELVVGTLPMLDPAQLRRAARLAVVRSSVYGVDLDPLAVEFARLALALLVPLDDVDDDVHAHVVRGDALVGPGFGLGAQGQGMSGLDFAAAFPDIDRAGGFDAIVGNPPFLGGLKITGRFGTDYRNHLVRHIAGGVTGQADLAAYFVLRAFDLVHPDRGQLGLITTNTIGQGHTRRVGLDQIEARGGTIRQAVKHAPWPTDTASVAYAVVWISRPPVSNPMALLLDAIPAPEGT